jgi:hypothetical protein
MGFCCRTWIVNIFYCRVIAYGNILALSSSFSEYQYDYFPLIPVAFLLLYPNSYVSFSFPSFYLLMAQLLCWYAL